ncbi:unnamed protein product [Microthlaspi erraticum]|uniref:Uncharacterized protein n=1 Tax=Microthlaspi erraticum TaxID=1685480 RepID=A0A6D2JYY3_9BRAS|nr:unnamed protein product [Microthlaspi erraticum]
MNQGGEAIPNRQQQPPDHEERANKPHVQPEGGADQPAAAGAVPQPDQNAPGAANQPQQPSNQPQPPPAFHNNGLHHHHGDQKGMPQAHPLISPYFT